MSLANLIIQGDLAHLVTDSGHYNTSDGKIGRLGAKMLALPKQTIALATTGELHVAHIANILKETAADERLNQEQFLPLLDKIIALSVSTYSLTQPSIVLLAGYLHAASRPIGGYFIANPGQPVSFVPMQAMLSPVLPWVNLSGLSEPSFNVYRDLLPLIKQQRRHNFGTEEAPQYAIAGDIDIVTVGRSGFFHKTLHTFPGEVGEAVLV